jgi:RNA polymerase sigma-70 factor, ECF subfamily
LRKLLTEAELIEAARTGEPAAVGQLLFTSAPALERYIRPKIPSEAQRHLSVDDVLQDVFTQAFRDIGSFHPSADGSFLAWLKGIADHRVADAIKRLRRKKRGGDRQQVSAKSPSTSSIAQLVEVVCRDDVTASLVLSHQEASQALQVAVAMLREPQRSVIRARYFDGLSVEQIAKQIGITDGAVRGLIHRGQKKLAELMGHSSHWFSR